MTRFVATLVLAGVSIFSAGVAVGHYAAPARSGAAFCVSDGGDQVAVGDAIRTDTGVWVCGEDGRFVRQ
jgi:hypothetical protein